MDIQTLLGEDYKEGITLDEINAALAKKDLVDKSNLPKSVEKSIFDKTASELAAAKKELEAIKETSLSEDEKVQKALEAAKAKETQFTKAMNKLEVEKIFLGNEISKEEYDEFIDDVVTEDSEKSIKFAESISKLIKKKKADLEKSIKADMLNNTPKPPTGEGGKPKAKDYKKEIDAAWAVGDRARVAALTREQQENKGD